MFEPNSIDLDKIAEGIEARGLTTCAILLLEAHKPLSLVVESAVTLASPVFSIFGGRKSYVVCRQIFQSRENIEYLIRKLESIRDGEALEA